ncbi:ADOP family duplicated permease [Silvibacterium sp.]|uniref:ABC transporter permease n=1 Tax=Silvibacterium sp. TaxID=1964179 RepID=UPI0039E38AF4
MAWFFGEKRKRELEDELASHLAMASAERRAAGENVTESDINARRELGNAALVQEATRAAWGWIWFERLAQDVRYALRQMRRSPGFATSVVGTLALGIGAATAMFTVVDHVMLQPLPYKDAGRLVEIGAAPNPGVRSVEPYPDIAAWCERSKSFEQIAFYADTRQHHYLQAHAATLVKITTVSGNLFSTLGIAPQIGPGLVNGPDIAGQSGNAQTVVMNDIAWRTLFHADSGVIGKTIQLDDHSYTVLGVMPKGFYFPEPTETAQFWMPAALTSKDFGQSYDAAYFTTVGRLKNGVSRAVVAAEMQTIQEQLVKGIPDKNLEDNGRYISIVSLASTATDGKMSKALLSLMGAAGLLWLIACVNATNLLLARASARQREIAVRGALGAGRKGLIQQLVVEGALLSGIAAGLGTALAMGMIVLLSHMPYVARQQFSNPNWEVSHRPFTTPAMPNLQVLLVVIGLTFLSAIVSSLWPAVMASYVPIEAVLRQGGQQGGTSRRQNRLRGGLIVAEIAMSLSLLAGCGLMLRTLYSLRHVPLGFRTDHILVANMAIPTYRFTKMNATKEVFEPLLEKVEHVPGVDAAGLVTQVPLGHTFTIMFGLDTGDRQGTLLAQFKAVSPGLQKVFGFEVNKGRYFNASDTAGSQAVAVVNKAFAQKFDPQEEDLGKLIGKPLVPMKKPDDTDKSSDRRATIIGIVDDFHQRAVGEAPQPEIELCLPQLSPETRYYGVLESMAMDLAVRTQRPPEEMIPTLRRLLREASPELGDANIVTMDQIVEDSFGSQQLAARLLEIFAGAALLLCVTGLYGLLAYVVSQRTREMGVRFALGAQRGDVMWLVMRQAGVLIIAGLGLGLVLVSVSGRVVRSYLFGVSAHDGWTLLAVILALLSCGVFAAYLPARRAAGVNPVDALRAE